MRITKLTENGVSRQIGVAISPDGRYVVYADDRKLGLSMRQVWTRSDVQILAQGDGVYYPGITISPDGNYLYFLQSETNNFTFKSLYVMPILGGKPRKLIGDIDSPISFSPDGRQFVFVRGVVSQVPNKLEIRIANADGTDERLLATRPAWPPGSNGVAWSPDGNTIAANLTYLLPSLQGKLEFISVADGSTREGYFTNAILEIPVWLPDGRSLIVPMQSNSTNRATQLWRISYPQGQIQAFTNDLLDYGAIDLARESNTLAAIQTTVVSSVWMAPGRDAVKAQPVTSDDPTMVAAAWLPHGKVIALGLNRGELWVTDAKGSDPAPFIPDRTNVEWVDACGDRYVVFAERREDKTELWRADVDGGNPTRLAEVYDELDRNYSNSSGAACTPDGESIYYSWDMKVWKAPTEGGDRVLVANIPSLSQDFSGLTSWTVLRVSRDGKWLAYSRYEPSTSMEKVPKQEIVVVPLTGGPPARILQQPPRAADWQWSPNGKSIQYTYFGDANIWEQPLEGGNPRRITNFKPGLEISTFRWSTDGKQLLLTRRKVKSNVVLMNHFQ
jgi:Tol biopolymer transport system component